MAETQLVTLALGAETFAIPVAFVREILDYTAPFAIPEGPAYLLGLMDVRGRATPTLDLRLKLGLARAEPTLATRVLVLDVPTDGRVLSLGLVADRVLAIARRDPTVIGVVGMGRNTSASQAAIRRLNDAGLAVVNTVNSSDQLPMLAHYYGLAATDHDVAVAGPPAGL